MSDAERQRWDQRYRDGSYRARPHATELLQKWQPKLPRGRALDIACGAGRNALYLAALGYEVDAVDIAPYALERARQAAAERGLVVNWIAADLGEYRLSTSTTSAPTRRWTAPKIPISASPRTSSGCSSAIWTSAIIARDW